MVGNYKNHFGTDTIKDNFWRVNRMIFIVLVAMLCTIFYFILYVLKISWNYSDLTLELLRNYPEYHSYQNA